MWISFSVDNVYWTQEIAQLRKHVERSTGRLKHFHILEGVVPLSIVPLISKIFKFVYKFGFPITWWKKSISEDYLVSVEKLFLTN